MKIGSLQLSGNLILAPMSGITDYPFRRIAREHGCGLVFTEMVSSEGLLRKGKAFLRIGRGESPLAVQLFGSNPDIMAEAAQMAESMGANVIDINMGCPAKQVVETGAGVALMRSCEKVREMLTKLRRQVKTPLTIKIRSGWDQEHINAIEISKIAEDCGVDAIFIHPRTKVQGFRGKADWNLIGDIKRALRIPVIGNGDVTSLFWVKRMFKETDCDGVMIGRGALGNPWIFGLNGRSSLEERYQLLTYHFSLLCNDYGETEAIKKIRKHVVWYTRGLPGSASFRSRLFKLGEKIPLFEAISSYFNLVKRREECQSSVLMENRFITGREGKVF